MNRNLAALMACCGAMVGCGSVKTLMPEMPPDAAIDAPDAMQPAKTKYDVAYINDITIIPAITSINSLVLVVNKGTAPLKLSTVDVVTYSDDSADIGWAFSKSGATTTMLMPSQAAGQLTPDAQGKLVDSGLVREPVVDNMLNFSMAFSTTPPTGVILHAQVVLRIETTDIVLPFTIKIVSSGFLALNAASRLSSQ